MGRTKIDKQRVEAVDSKGYDEQGERNNHCW
jgi:hypothetical protein